METKTQKELMKYAKKILSYGVPNILLSRFERIAIKRYEEIKLKHNKN